MNPADSPLSYVLITPARNEEAYIEKTIRSVINQIQLPRKWVIVDDGSTDSTAAIVSRLIRNHDWIELVRISPHAGRDFSSKADCFNAGYQRVKHLRWDVIGNLDADVSFGEDHLQFLITRFQSDPMLGVAGTVFREEGYSSEHNSFEGAHHVPGQCQLFRRECFEHIGGYVAHAAGGIDWIAVTMARMRGWKTRAFRERWFFHHRTLGTAGRGLIASAFAYGEKDYYLGNHPVWELLRVGYRMVRRPYLVAGAALGLGYLEGCLRRPTRPVTREFVRFHRHEQMDKLKAIVVSLLKRGRIDRFRLAAE